MKVSKKGKVFFNKSKASSTVKVNKDNNRKKNYYLQEGTVIPPLVDMGAPKREKWLIPCMTSIDRLISLFSL